MLGCWVAIGKIYTTVFDFESLRSKRYLQPLYELGRVLVRWQLLISNIKIGKKIIFFYLKTDKESEQSGMVQIKYVYY